MEREPTAAEYLAKFKPSGSAIQRYLRSLFPFWDWIFHYNLTWLFGDIIAGVTVGFVVIPQGMAYALLAKLPPEYGLYTSFVGFILYWAFATSKDITVSATFHNIYFMLTMLDWNRCRYEYNCRKYRYQDPGD